MEKILLVINAHRPDMACIDFACRMAATTGSKLTGLFIENLFDKHTAFTLEETAYFGATQGAGKAATAVFTDTDQAIKIFVKQCGLKNVPAETYLDKGEPIQEVVYESRFADLLILDPKTNFYGDDDQVPSHFTREVLAGAECPVLLAPERFEGLREIIFCYDGSASAVFATKQFTYIFPQLAAQKAVLLEVNKSGTEEFSESHRRMMEWLRAHYESVAYQSLKGTPKESLVSFLSSPKPRMVVMGSYGRSLLSNFFRPSTADALLRAVDLPVFIAHP